MRTLASIDTHVIIRLVLPDGSYRDQRATRAEVAEHRPDLLAQPRPDLLSQPRPSRIRPRGVAEPLSYLRRLGGYISQRGLQATVLTARQWRQLERMSARSAIKAARRGVAQ